MTDDPFTTSEELTIQVQEALRLYAAGEVDRAGHVLAGTLSGVHESLAVAFGLAESLLRLIRDRSGVEVPPDVPLVVSPMFVGPGDPPAHHREVIDLFSAVLAAAGNHDLEGVHLLWHRHSQRVCVDTTIELFAAVSTLAVPDELGGG